MLLKFHCSNFKSILKTIEFSAFAGSYKRHPNHLMEFEGNSILRTSAIYGSNGSGKSNFIEAIGVLKHFITVGPRDKESKIAVPIFKLKDCEKIPTIFQIDFVKNQTRYKYYLEILKNNITAEELIIVKANGEANEVIFERKLDINNIQKISLGLRSEEDIKEKIREEIYSEEIPHNASFLKEGYNKNLENFENPYNWFLENLKVDESDDQYGGIAFILNEDSTFLKNVVKVLKAANLGIEEVKVEEYSEDEMRSIHSRLINDIEDEFEKNDALAMDFLYDGALFCVQIEEDKGGLKFAKLSTFHKSENGTLIEFDFTEESNGVKRLFEVLLPALYRALYEDETIILDEIESSFHPVLLKEILRLYLDSKLRNGNKGQLIFTTHESNLLDLELFRQDEIWFCEKTNQGETVLYSLSEFKPRFDKDIRKGYLEGQFSAIPFLSNPESLTL